MNQTVTAPAVLLENVSEVRPKAVDERILGLLRTLARDIPGLSSVVVSDAQGLPISALVRGTGATAATAMGTLLRSAAKSVTANLGLPTPEDIVIQAGSAVVLVRCLAGDVTLMAVLRDDANLGFAKLELNRRSGELQALLQQLR